MTTHPIFLFELFSFSCELALVSGRWWFCWYLACADSVLDGGALNGPGFGRDSESPNVANLGSIVRLMCDLVGGPLGRLCLLGEGGGTGRRYPVSGAEPLRPFVVGPMLGGARRSTTLSTSCCDRTVGRRMENIFAAVV